MKNSPLQIGLVQINNSFSGQNYLPYSVACLQSYVEEHAQCADRLEFLDPVYKRQPISDIVDHLQQADLVGFSTYVWNANISLEVARRLKAKNPALFIVFGGPQVPDCSEAFLRENAFIDLAVHNEGETQFTALLDSLAQGELATGLALLLGASYIDADGVYMRAQDAPKIRDLAAIPSPFLNGMFDALVEKNPEESWIGLWETNRGCPFQCTFCDWGSATASKLNKFEEERLLGEIQWFSDNHIDYIFCCDANFGILPRDIEIAKRVAEMKDKTGYPVALSVQNTKNATERAYEAQKILADAGLNKGVALSMQSLDETTLKAIKRENIALETYFELQRRFTSDKIETYSDLILGLPGETYDSFIKGVDGLINSGQHNRIQFNNLSILPNAEMGEAAYQEAHGMETVRSEIINIHGSKLELQDDVAEWQDLVIATHTTPKDDWRKVRAFCWMAGFLHFDKIMQYPLIIAHELAGVSYSLIFERFMEQATEGDAYPLVSEIARFFDVEAARIQAGGTEYVYSEEWLGVYWPADEYMYIKLTAEEKFEEFYDQAGRLLVSIIQENALQKNADLGAVLAEAIRVNKAMVSQPFVKDDIELALKFNILDYCDAIKVGKNIPLKAEDNFLTVERSQRVYADFNKWCQEVVWWGNKKGAYLYNRKINNVELAGHY
ncbi:MAG: radical SAM protein [Kordiimonadaceae bacterium]|nr:radical SAM protein [Kordiimonadaceae bacterium]